MAITFKVPDSPNKSILEIDNFQGADFTNTPATVDIHKSPNLLNMVRDVPGKIRKSLGYELYKTIGEGSINGAFAYNTLYEKALITDETIYIEKKIIHSGNNVYVTNKDSDDWKLISSDLMNNRSVAFPLGDSLFILDGNKLFRGYLKTVSTDYSASTSNEVEATTATTSSTSARIDFNSATSGYSLVNVSNATKITWKYQDGNGSKFSMAPTTYTNPPYSAYLPAYVSVSISKIICTYVVGSTTSTITSTLGISNSEKILIKPLTLGLAFNALNTYNYGTDFSLVIYNVLTGASVYNGAVTYYPDESSIPSGGRGFRCVPQTSDGFLKLWFQSASPADLFDDGTYKMVLTYASLVSTTIYFKYLNGVMELYTFSEKQFVIEECDTSQDVYVPTLTISKNPSGGGTAYEDLNMINSAFTERFVVTSSTASATQFHMSFSNLDNVEPIVYVMDASGNFVKKELGTEYTFDYVNGTITFVNAPGVSPVTGEDNVKITAYRTINSYKKKINHCTIGALFGVGGNTDRLFLSGNSEYPNYDWHSGENDGTYFPDTGYSILGKPDSSIVGYSIVNNYLATHKDSNDSDRNVILRQGNLEDNKAVFPIVAMLQGPGAIAKYSFQILDDEPLFLTDQGIYAITSQDITGEKYGQNRSFFLDGKMLNENDISNAITCVYNNQYILVLNSHAYILDGLQIIQTDKSMPYATRQYAGFYRTNIPATAIWVWDNRLYFGTSDGKIFRFFHYKDKSIVDYYNDNGAAITCQYDTPDFNGQYFFHNKTFRYLAVRLDAALRTSIQYWVMRHGIWTFIKTEAGKARWIDFANINFAKFSFSTDSTQKTLHTKIRIKKVDKARFRFVNDQINEPFGLYNVALEYVENGNYKG